MKSVCSFLLILLLLSLSACGGDPAPADTDIPLSGETADTETSAPDTAADTEPEEDPSYAPSGEGFEWIAPDGAYKLVFGKATVVVQGAPGDSDWGHYQFPSFGYTGDGFLVINWAYSSDTIQYKAPPAGMVTRKVSVNKGKSWMLPTSMDVATSVTEDRRMADGRYFCGFSALAAHKGEYLLKYEEALSFDAYSMYFAEDLYGVGEAAADTQVKATVYDPEAKRYDTFAITLNWPHAPLVKHPGNMVYPLTMTFSLCNRAIRIIDGEPYIFLYTRGFDSDAESRAEAADKFSRNYSVYTFHSPDYGHTWNYLSQIRLDDELFSSLSRTNTYTFDGLCEPQVTVAPDGTWVMLIRSGSDNPCCISSSTDGGKTWTRPAVFDECGVLPQIVTLDCGVTLSTYGRPRMYFRATDDPSALTWDEHIPIPLCAKEGTDPIRTSCFNNAMTVLDGDSVLIAYSDFRYPNKDGVKVKTVLTRTVDVVLLTEQ